MRRQISIFLIAVMMTGTLAGCRQNPTDAEKQASRQNKVNLSTEEMDTVPSSLPLEVTRPEGDALSADSQLYTILQKRKKWQNLWGGSDLEGESMHFAVTDFDQNGRLELLVSSGPQGSGFYTTNWLYQISEDGTKLKQCQYDKNVFDSCDLYESITQVVCEKDTGKYYYGCDDYTHISGDENYSTMGLFTLADCVVQCESLGYEDIGDLNSEKDDTYYQMTGKEKKITKQEYTLENLASSKYKKCEIKPVCIHWFQFAHRMEDVTDVQLMHALEQSWQRFGIGKKAEKTDDYEVPLDQIDWEAYQYQMTDEEYRALWDFMPLLSGEAKMAVNGDWLTLDAYYRGDMPEVDSLRLQDVTGDEIPELILDISFTNDTRTILLSRQDKKYYWYDIYNDLQDTLSTAIVYDSGIVEYDWGTDYYRFHLQDEKLDKTRIAYIKETGTDIEYYIGNKKVSEEAFYDWEDEELGEEALSFAVIAKEG
ncbi:MAG: hypothetical protein Q4D32_06305 [Eubacteriales bacterium]|nr:hypothetical protein [Eubacteriales bacterium]